jgi:excisionase family DNA binding protein
MERPTLFPPQSSPTQTTLQPLAVAPREACKLLSLGISTIYSLMRSGELESFADGRRMRRITVASIHAYVARRIADSDSKQWRARQLRRGKQQQQAAVDDTLRVLPKPIKQVESA